ncbi:carbonic anhydrase [Oxobacter pfennigii]|uniref:Carbonic anhydrase n=1 Tax=Oxobacter pfennigii TaxID=36849 RepID=A0A0P8WPP6_9CLOT|nr:carbonic anhydrase [Oxobacter pfennigii]KPU44524.1 carbonic anhydrase [Oxobacter pfennigii]
MHKIIKVSHREDILKKYSNTPIEKLLLSHNIGLMDENFTSAELLIGMCMDNRNQLRIPNNFAYIIRSGGGNLRYSEFKVSYAIAVGGVKAIALIGHNNCGMVNLMSQKDKFVNGLVENAGWDIKRAEEHFMNFAPMFEIDDEIGFLCSEAARLRVKYPKILIAPLIYNVDDNLIYIVEEE